MSNLSIGIVGGGLVGLTLANVIAQQTHADIHLFEKQGKKTNSNNKPYNDLYDARSIALSSGGINILNKYHLWPNLAPFSSVIDEIKVSKKNHWGTTNIKATEEQVEALGWVIEAPKLASLIEQQLKGQKQVHTHWGANVTNLTPLKDGYQINGNFPKTNVTLLIIADGEQSESCKNLGIKQFRREYNQSAVVGNVDLSTALNTTAIERFTNQGVIALLPLNTTKHPNRSAFIWVTQHKKALELINMDTSAFLECISSEFNQRYQFSSLGKLKHYPLAATTVSEIIRPNLIVIGNAAHGLHPIGAQGFNLSLRDIDAIVQMIQHAIKHNIALGNYQLLDQYQSLRIKDQQQVSIFINQLIKLYTKGSPSIPRSFTSAGLFLFDILPNSKKQLARFAMGAQQPRSFEYST